MKFSLAFFLLVVAITAARAELAVHSLFADHVVLQRDKPVAIWGTTDPAAEVTAAFAG